MNPVYFTLGVHSALFVQTRVTCCVSELYRQQQQRQPFLTGTNSLRRPRKTKKAHSDPTQLLDFLTLRQPLVSFHFYHSQCHTCIFIFIFLSILRGTPTVYCQCLYLYVYLGLMHVYDEPAWFKIISNLVFRFTSFLPDSHCFQLMFV